MNLRWTLIALVIGCHVLLPAPVMPRDPRCGPLTEDARQKRVKISQYVDALREMDRQGDLRLMRVFVHEIDQLLDGIAETDGPLDCPRPIEQAAPQAMGPVKADVGIHLDKSCGELRQMLIRLIVRINRYKRREKSMYAQLSVAERKDLDRTVEEFEQIKEALRARCLAGMATRNSSRRQRLRR